MHEALSLRKVGSVVNTDGKNILLSGDLGLPLFSQMTFHKGRPQVEGGG